MEYNNPKTLPDQRNIVTDVIRNKCRQLTFSQYEYLYYTV